MFQILMPCLGTHYNEVCVYRILYLCYSIILSYIPFFLNIILINKSKNAVHLFIVESHTSRNVYAVYSPEKMKNPLGFFLRVHNTKEIICTYHIMMYTIYVSSQKGEVFIEVFISSDLGSWLVGWLIISFFIGLT